MSVSFPFRAKSLCDCNDEERNISISISLIPKLFNESVVYKTHVKDVLKVWNTYRLSIPKSKKAPEYSVGHSLNNHWDLSRPDTR
jgi:hypothetical protein